MPKFPCKYVFGGKAYTHNEFRALLADGALDHLIDNKIVSLKTKENEQATSGQRPTVSTTEGKAEPQKGNIQPGGTGGSNRPQEVRESKVSTPGGEGEEITTKKKENAIQEQSATAVHVLETPGHSEKMGGRNEVEGAIDKSAAAKKENIVEARHGLTREDKEGVTSGQTDVPLDKEGRQKAQVLAEELKGEGITKVVGSDLKRNLQTGEEVAKELDVPHETNPGLRSWDEGEWDKTPDTEWKEAKAYYTEHPDELEYKGKKLGETFNQYKERVLETWKQIRANAKEKTLVINHSDNMMLRDAIDKYGAWNEDARKYFLEEKTPEPATVHEGIGKEEPQAGEPVTEQAGVPLVKEFYEHDVRPALVKLTGSLADSYQILRRVFNPKAGVSEKAINHIQGALGDRNEAEQAIHRALGAFEKMFNKMPNEKRIDFIDRMKRGQKQETPFLDQVAGLIRDLDENLFDEIQKYKPSLKWKEDHFRVLWKKIPGSGKEKFWSARSRRPIQGSRGFFKKATLADMSEGIEMGGEPQSTNPITMFKLAYADGMKYITAQRMWEGLKKDKFVKFVRKGGDVPEGYKQINDNIAKVFFPTKEGLVQAGEYWVDPGAARLLNNFLSKDWIRSTMAGRSLMNLKNLFTQVELGLSAFHAIAESLEAISSQAALGLRKAITLGWRERDLGMFMSGIKDIATSPAAPALLFKAGRRFINLASEKDFENSKFGKSFLQKIPDAKQYIHDFFQGGGIMRQHEDLRGVALKGLREHAGKDNYIGAALRVLPAFNEMIMNPLFGYYIPALKVGMFMKEFPVSLKENAERLANKQISREALARKTVEFIDDRLGEMNFDNLFWDRTFKTSMQFTFRSVTWKLGNVRAMVGAPIEQMQEIINAAKENRKPILMPKMAWLLSLSAMQVAVATVLQKLFTGKDPETFKDIVAPQIDKDDPDQRVVLPTYIKDMLHAYHSPVGYATTSFAGPINAVNSVWNNKDFYGYEIYDPHGTRKEKAEEISTYLLPKPFAITSAKELHEKGEPFGKVAMSFLGLTKAPAYLTHSPIQNEIFDLYRVRNAGVRPHGEREGAQAKAEIRRLYKENKREEAEDLAKKYIKDGLLRPTQIKYLFQHAPATGDISVYFFSRLPFEDKEYLYNKMSDEEKKIYDPAGKFGRALDAFKKMQAK